MKTWRERIAEARERGHFTENDVSLWSDGNTCFVGEMRERYGILFNLGMTGVGLGSLMKHDHTLQMAIHTSLREHNFDEAEHLLDYVEERALELKREDHR